ncbi:haspin Ser/Thr kinase [Encephalitozoon romaleae SJ-2008]|uniref:non-specific serine/threonine protein kinase n=1 Tax=Encephalitozoon romaleae (strain SJ-2008) TaxID=1178016 RepID=I6ZHN4_ENCRO|nr:haspin Ser/Thr kinase [Encephalitozoon romaleae SJ-2008]AFN82698.1 haspin Ser/Thr kinase [Encephalitozoon romaleae SJ-2008]
MKRFGRKRESIHNTAYEEVRKAFEDIRRKIADTGRLSSSGLSTSTSPGNASWKKDYSCDLAFSSSGDEEDCGLSSIYNSRFKARSKDEAPGFGDEREDDLVINHDVLSSSETYDESLGFESFLDEEIKRESKMQNITFRRKKGIDHHLHGQDQRTEGSVDSDNGGDEMGVLKRIPFDKMPKNIRKIGEATFSEVFAHGTLVYKIIPLGNTSDETSLPSFLKESTIFKAISEEDGVCKLKDVFLVKGRYPREYLKAWDDYGEEENERPSKYEDSQEYGVIVMEDGGESLESIRFQGIEEADRFIRTVIRTLARLEEKYEFEHRDLHWGNILIKQGHINLIDFSLSRLKNGNTVIFNDLNDRQWLFEGDEEVDVQFKVYRDMRELCSGHWERFTPQSNVLWIRYLVEKTFGKNKFKGKKALISQYMSIIDRSTSAKDIDKKLRV